MERLGIMDPLRSPASPGCLVWVGSPLYEPPLAQETAPYLKAVPPLSNPPTKPTIRGPFTCSLALKHVVGHSLRQPEPPLPAAGPQEQKEGGSDLAAPPPPPNAMQMAAFCNRASFAQLEGEGGWWKGSHTMPGWLGNGKPSPRDLQGSSSRARMLGGGSMAESCKEVRGSGSTDLAAGISPPFWMGSVQGGPEPA